MPSAWNNHLVVTKDELIPAYFNNWNTLKSVITRTEKEDYGIKKLRIGGNGREVLIDFDTLPKDIQRSIGDPRKLNHVMEQFYATNPDAVRFYQNFTFEDNTSLSMEHQERYITNASVMSAAVKLKNARESERKSKGGSMCGIMKTICEDVASFNQILKTKHKVEHSIPPGEKQFKKLFKSFQGSDRYKAIISNKHKTQNARKVFEHTIELLNNLFAENISKPTATEVFKKYSHFIKGEFEVINQKTGEQYKPTDFEALCDRTVTTYLKNWENKIGTYAKRSGDRQKYMQLFKPAFSLEAPKFSGSMISIDDRQPPFKDLNGDRPWFYNGIDLASEVFTCSVFGKTKEGIIDDFYRQLVRNYHEWNLPIPAELEAEMSLNSKFLKTFLVEGAMFQYVKIEANNARGKRIEAYYRPLRYELEKKREGWLARPFALSESNQAGPEKVPQLPYEQIIEGCIDDINTWNNSPHSKNPKMSRWDYFLANQCPDVLPTNYRPIIRHLGYKTKTSVNVGIVKLNNGQCLLAQNGSIALGERLISLMTQVEGKEIDVYWLDDNYANILQAHAYIGNQFICELMPQPKPQRAKIEQTANDIQMATLMNSYVATIESFGRNGMRALEPMLVIDNRPKPENKFQMKKPIIKTNPTLNYQWPEDLNSEPEPQPERSFTKSLKDRF